MLIIVFKLDADPYMQINILKYKNLINYLLLFTTLELYKFNIARAQFLISNIIQIHFLDGIIKNSYSIFFFIINFY